MNAHKLKMLDEIIDKSTDNLFATYIIVPESNEFKEPISPVPYRFRSISTPIQLSEEYEI